MQYQITNRSVRFVSRLISQSRQFALHPMAQLGIYIYIYRMSAWIQLYTNDPNVLEKINEYITHNARHPLRLLIDINPIIINGTASHYLKQIGCLLCYMVNGPVLHITCTNKRQFPDLQSFQQSYMEECPQSLVRVKILCHNQLRSQSQSSIKYSLPLTSPRPWHYYARSRAPLLSPNQISVRGHLRYPRRLSLSRDRALALAPLLLISHFTVSRTRQRLLYATVWHICVYIAHGRVSLS